MVYQFGFQGMKEAFRHGVLPAIAFAAHTLCIFISPSVWSIPGLHIGCSDQNDVVPASGFRYQ
jgi:hypothetical protein